MRFAVVAFSAAALAALSGCSSPVPATPDAAWEVNMTNNGGTCQISNSTRSLGVLTDADIETRITDGVMGATISCSVVGTGTGPFAIEAELLQGADSLDISIPAISAGATKTAPALGTIQYESDATVVAYQGTCNFYFATGTKEGVNATGIYVAFTCGGITDAQSSPASTCPVLESYALFENCVSSAM